MKQRELQIPSFAVSLLRFLFAHRHEFDVIHAHGTLPHTAASIAGRVLRKPTILKIAMANSDIAFAQQGRLRGRVNRVLVRGFDSYIATTPEIVTEFATEGLDQSRVALVPNGVDTEVFSPVTQVERSRLRGTLGLPDVPTAVYVGIISSRKNVDGILRAWRRVCEVRPEAHLALVGPMPEEGDPFLAQIRAYIEEHGLSSRVTFTGRRDPVVPYLQAADAFIFPSRKEGMANSVLEAMSTGLPCLVSAAAGVAAVIRDGDNGFALDVDDELGLAAKLTALLTDTNLRDRVGEAARRTIETSFSLEQTARRYVELYNRLLERPVDTELASGL